MSTAVSLPSRRAGAQPASHLRSLTEQSSTGTGTHFWHGVMLGCISRRKLLAGKDPALPPIRSFILLSLAEPPRPCLYPPPDMACAEAMSPSPPRPIRIHQEQPLCSSASAPGSGLTCSPCCWVSGPHGDHGFSRRVTRACGPGCSCSPRKSVPGLHAVLGTQEAPCTSTQEGSLPR